MTGRVLTLTAEDHRGTADLDRLAADLGDALVAVSDFERRDERTGRVIPGARLTIDSSRIRDTHAHGLACRAGFVAWLEALR